MVNSTSQNFSQIIYHFSKAIYWKYYFSNTRDVSLAKFSKSAVYFSRPNLISKIGHKTKLKTPFTFLSINLVFKTRHSIFQIINLISKTHCSLLWRLNFENPDLFVDKIHKAMKIRYKYL